MRALWFLVLVVQSSSGRLSTHANSKIDNAVRITVTVQTNKSRKDSSSLPKRSLSEGVVKETWGPAMMDDGGAPLPNPQAVRSRDILSGVDCQTSAVLVLYYTPL